ncbi:MAG: hypothetical protein R3A48_08245 [Polyangiales bacterium]
MRPATATALGALWIAAQLVIPAARAHPSSPYPASGRFSWTMFAGPLVGRCEHALRVSLSDARPAPMPLRGSAMRTVLDARAPGEFSQAVWLFAPYADSDAEVAASLDALLRRWARTLPPGATLVSELRCASPGWPRFTRRLQVRR